MTTGLASLALACSLGGVLAACGGVATLDNTASGGSAGATQPADAAGSSGTHSNTTDTSTHSNTTDTSTHSNTTNTDSACALVGKLALSGLTLILPPAANVPAQLHVTVTNTGYRLIPDAGARLECHSPPVVEVGSFAWCAAPNCGIDSYIGFSSIAPGDNLSIGLSANFGYSVPAGTRVQCLVRASASSFDATPCPNAQTLPIELVVQ